MLGQYNMFKFDEKQMLKKLMKDAGISYSHLMYMDIPCEKCNKPYFYMDFIKKNGKERLRALCEDHFKEWVKNKKQSKCRKA